MVRTLRLLLTVVVVFLGATAMAGPTTRVDARDSYGYDHALSNTRPAALRGASTLATDLPQAAGPTSAVAVLSARLVSVVATERGLFDVRPLNPEFPPSESVVDAMGRTYHPNCDCSEIAQDLMSANGGKGNVIRYEPPKGSPLQVPEQGGNLIENYTYHEVYSDGRYVYDPSFSSTPVPKGDYDRMIRGLNPGVRGG